MSGTRIPPCTFGASLGLALAWLCLLSACASGPRAARLDIFASGNINGYLENCGCSGGQMGGMARRAAQLKVEIAAAKKPQPGDAGKPAEALIIDCGDFTDPTVAVRNIESKGVVQSMGVIGYDSVGLGLNETDTSEDHLLGLISQAKLPYNAANLTIIPPQTGKDCSKELNAMLRPYIIVRKPSGLRVGVIHLIDNTRMDLPAREKLGYRLADPISSANTLLKAHGGEADVWVVSVSALRHGALDANALLQLPGVRAVAGLASYLRELPPGDTPWAHPSGSPPPVSSAVLIGRPMDKGKDMLALELPLGQAKAAAPKPRQIMLSDKISPDPQVLAIYERLKPEREALEITDARQAMQLQAGGQEHPYYLGWSACSACHKVEVDALAGSRHMQAYATLAAKGQEHTSCAKCHTVGYNRPSGYNAVLDREQKGDWLLRNVQCENCHGAGEYHVMLHTGKPAPHDLQEHARDSEGLLRANQSSCMGCHDHDNSPHFNYDTYWAKIEHGKKKDPKLAAKPVTAKG